MQTATLGRFIDAYLDAALWSSVDPDTEGNLDDRFDWRDIDPDWLLENVADCRAFIEENWGLFALVEDMAGPDQHGHDFWLTRNRHGAGFWDRGYGATGQLLTERTRAYGPMDLGPWDFVASLADYV